jgi:hypothetical protein
VSGIRTEVDGAGLEVDGARMQGDGPGDRSAARAAGVLAIAAGWGHQTAGIPAEQIVVLAGAPSDVADLVLGRWARP